MKRKLLTRREVIDLWLTQSPDFLDSYVCPNCRDILDKKDDNIYFCSNPECENYKQEVSPI